MRVKVSKARRVVSLVLAAVLVLPMMSVSTASAAGPDFSGGPVAGSAPTLVPNDHTPLAVRVAGSGLDPDSTYYVKVRLTLNPNPATGGQGQLHRGFIWNKTTGQWVINKGPAWTEFPQIQTDASGNIVSANDANWLFFKFGNENNSGTYYLNITLNKDGVDTTSRNSDTPLQVQVLDMKTQGAWLHNGTVTSETDFKRVTLNEYTASSSATQVVSVSRTETNTIDDDSNSVVDDEDYGPVGKTGDWRLAASAETTVDVYLRTTLQTADGGSDYVMGGADQDIALGAADQSAPTSPTALDATSADGKVNLEWDAATDDNAVAHYNVYRWVDTSAVEYTSPHVLIGTSPTTSFEDATVTGGDIYNYEVRAVDTSSNVSARSDKATIEALPPIPTVSAAAAPTDPNGEDDWYVGTAPTITLTSAATAKFAWDAPAGPFTTYATPIPTKQGVHTLYYFAEDAYGQKSDVEHATFKVDTVKPTASVSAPYFSTDQSTTRKFTVSLSSGDAAPGSGVASYDVDKKVGASGSWGRLATKTTAKSLSVNGSAGSTYYFRVRAHDQAGNVGAWSAQDLTMVPYDNAQMNIKGYWKSLQASSYYLETTRRAKSSSASAILKFKGGSAAYLITSTRPNRGRFKVYRDGHYIKTVSLYSSSTKYRQRIYLCSLKGSGEHSIKLQAVRVSNRRPYADIDGLAIKR